MTSAKLADQVEIPAFGELEHGRSRLPGALRPAGARDRELRRPPGRGRSGRSPGSRSARRGPIRASRASPSEVRSDSPGSSTADLHPGRELRELSGEAARRLAEELSRAPAQVAADQRAPVDRDHDPRADPRRGLGRRARVRGAPLRARPPARDRQQRDVERPASSSISRTGRCRRRSRRARPPPRSRIPRASTVRADLEAPALVNGWGGGDLDGADRGRSRRRAARPRRRTRGGAASARRPPGRRPGSRGPKRFSEGKSRWSWCRCEIRTASIASRRPRAPGSGGMAVDDPAAAAGAAPGR